MKEKINYFNCMKYKCELCRYNEQCFGKKYKNNKVGEKNGKSAARKTGNTHHMV